MAEVEFEDNERYARMKLAPGALLFVVMYFEIDDHLEDVMIVAFNALTLERQHSFGRASAGFDRLYSGMEVINQELFVADLKAGCLRVFSFSGEHLREVRGDWGPPQSFCFVEDRIYLIEATGIHSPDIPLASGSHWASGHRVVAITPEGDTLQSYAPDLTSMGKPTQMRKICHLDGRLIISAESRDGSHLIALQGV